jgi:hypothetical protein
MDMIILILITTVTLGLFVVMNIAVVPQLAIIT